MRTAVGSARVLAVILALTGCRRGVRAQPDARAGARRGLTPARATERTEPNPEAPRPLPGPLAACVRRVRQVTPPELAAALDALEYPAAIEDACRLDLAVTTRDRALCDGVALSLARDRCQGRAAIAAARPEDCPAADLDLGRDPFCIALAARSPALCAAAGPSDQVRCLAVAHGAAEECDALDAALRPRCRADVVALRPVLSPSYAALLPCGTASLRITLGTEPNGGSRTQAYTLAFLARGTFIDPEGTLWLVDPMRGWPSVFATSLASEQPIVGVSIALPPRPGLARLIDLRIVLPDGRVIEPAPALSGATVRLIQLARDRGSTITGTLSVQARVIGQPATVDLTFQTFVRDVVAADVVLGRSEVSRGRDPARSSEATGP
jgi:hypothetical protein